MKSRQIGAANGNDNPANAKAELLSVGELLRSFVGVLVVAKLADNFAVPNPEDFKRDCLLGAHLGGSSKPWLGQGR